MSIFFRFFNLSTWETRHASHTWTLSAAAHRAVTNNPDVLRHALLREAAQPHAPPTVGTSAVSPWLSDPAGRASRLRSFTARITATLHATLSVRTVVDVAAATAVDSAADMEGLPAAMVAAAAHRVPLSVPPPTSLRLTHLVLLLVHPRTPLLALRRALLPHFPTPAAPQHTRIPAAPRQ